MYVVIKIQYVRETTVKNTVRCAYHKVFLYSCSNSIGLASVVTVSRRICMLAVYDS